MKRKSQEYDNELLWCKYSNLFNLKSYLEFQINIINGSHTNNDFDMEEKVDYNFVEIKELHSIINKIGIPTKDFILLSYLIGNDFTKLASNPVTIIPAVASKNIVPLSVTVKYECNGNQGNNLLIGFESLLGSNINSASWGMPIGLTVGDKGIGSRIALIKMDWDVLTAVDILAIFRGLCKKSD